MMMTVITLARPTPAAAGGVVGDGTAASCTNQALINALDGGGMITFNCGSGNVTIPISTTLQFEKWDTVLDGGNRITLEGTSGTRIIEFRTWGYNAARTVTLRNLTITGASRTGVRAESNGAAVHVRNQSANFDQDLPTLNVENVTFTDNRLTQTSPQEYAYDYGGAAIYILGGVLNVSDSTFSGNRADGAAGGALHGLGSNITITNSEFYNNVATNVELGDPHGGYGGALYVDGAIFRGNGSIIISNSIFDGNQADGQGGVAYVNLYSDRRSYFSIDRSTFTNNSVVGGTLGWGGAISGGSTPRNGVIPNPVYITRSLFAGNSVDSEESGGDGGAVAFPQVAQVTIANSTFVNNEAIVNGPNYSRGRGGAMYLSNNDSNPAYKLVNLTIANNTAGWMGGGVFGSNGTMTNTIIANNTALDRGGNGTGRQQCAQQARNGGNNIQYPDRSGSNDVYCVPGIAVAQPQLGNLNGDGVLPLQAGSPAIDNGSNVACAAAPVSGVDQLGQPRPMDGNGDGSAVCDVGAYESGHVSSITNLDVSGGLSSAPVHPNFSWTNSDTTASWYNLYIGGPNGAVFNAWYDANEICSGTTCSVKAGDDPAQAYGEITTLPLGLLSGDYSWTVAAYNGSPNLTYAFGPGFSVNIPNARTPNPSVNAGQGRPVVNWSNDTNSMWYQIWIGNSSTTLFFGWVEATDELCGGAQCSFHPDVYPVAGDYQVWMQAWGPGGFSTGGASGWGGPGEFSYSDQPARPMTDLQVNGSGTTYTWTQGNNNRTTGYEVWIGSDAPDYAQQHYGWHLANTLGCTNGGTCTLTLDDMSLAPGDYIWYVQAWGPGGFNEVGWTDGEAFTIE